MLTVEYSRAGASTQGQGQRSHPSPQISAVLLAQGVLPRGLPDPLRFRRQGKAATYCYSSTVRTLVKCLLVFEKKKSKELSNLANISNYFIHIL